MKYELLACMKCAIFGRGVIVSPECALHYELSFRWAAALKGATR